MALAATPEIAMHERRPTGRALVWLVCLAVLFFSTYNFANWLASLRADVPSFAFEWERRIPFVPWTIVPYWSIDLLYGLSVLVCATRRELDMQGRRLLTAQAISVAFFVAAPLHFSFDRPSAGGMFGALFDALGAFDKPFNQAPSLHIALLVIIWTRLAAHASGPLVRAVLHAWMLLIGVSVLTTYQHHFIDVPTGLAAGLACLWLWPDDAPSPLTAAARTQDPARRRLALRYLGGALVCAVAAALGGGLWLLLWWPALALAIVAANYFLLGVHGFQKRRDGRHSLAAASLLAPYVAGAWINSRLWTHAEPGAQHVDDGVWLGRMPTRRSMRGSPFRTLVDLTAELPAPRGEHDYSGHPVLDLTAASSADLRAAAQAIERARGSGPVLVCCALGYSRSASAVAAWLLHTGRAGTVNEAISTLRRARPRVVLSDRHRAMLEDLRP